MALALASPSLWAQEAPKRLSQWLLEQPVSTDAYPLGLSWRVPEETAGQAMLRLELLQALAEGNRAVRADRASVARLRDWLVKLPITGRVPIALADARWLMANPDRDPVLLPGHTVVMPKRPGTVTVVKEDGRLCRVAHKSGYEAGAYLDACAAGDARADWVWIAQPDGRVQRFGVATWNREQQDEPAPGAWLWAPGRGSGWPESFSGKLIKFLATQGPAPDATSLDPGLRRDDDTGGRAAGFPAGQGERDPSTPLRSAQDERLEAPSETPVRSRGLEVSASDWGHVGLLQTPTARMREPGHFSFHLSHAHPYTHGNVFMQAFDWMEAGFRYTSVSNRTTALQQAFEGESYKDKGFDVKFRLWPESAYVPQIALGFRDVAGTGLFSGEYLVASKRTGNFDWSYGLGWGYLAGESRPRDTGSGGNFAFGTYFSGRAKTFGGVQWQTPWEKFILKLEYDANSYQNEPQGNTQRHESPWNVGLVYRLGSAVDLSLGFERGNKVMLGLTLHSRFDRLTTPKISDPPRVPVAATRPQQAPDWKATAREVARQSDWQVRSIEQRGAELRVTIEEPEAVYWKERVDRAVGVLHRDAPQDVDRFVFVYRARGTEMAEHIVDRDAWVARHTQYLPPGEKRETVIARAPESFDSASRRSGRTEDSLFQAARGPFEGGVRLGYGQTLGGPDAFLLYQIYGEGRGRWRLRDDTWLQGALRLRVIDNYDKFQFTAPSNLPRVRTFLREYLTTSDITIPNLMLAHVGKAAEGHYYSAYGGYLEEMFGGVGAEWLYRPFASRIALGVDVNEVKQRDFHQNFAFRDYRVTTGHATLYWETGWNDVLAKVSAGRYLAGDIGATIDLSRTFRNGVTIGAFATKTNVSAAEFGEGSFDKGIYVAVPFDAMFSRTSGATANFVWKPLTRDGGAMLGRPVTLYNLTSVRGERALKMEPAPLPNEAVLPADRVESWQPQSAGPEPYTRVTPKPERAQWREDSSHEYRLIEALHRQRYRNVRVAYDASRRLTVSLANDEIRPISRAVGRAARTALNLAPIDAREIRIVYAERAAPAVMYDFVDLARLRRYFEGAIPVSEIKEFVVVEYINPAAKERDPLARLDDLDPKADAPLLATLVPETVSLGRVVEDFAEAGRTAGNINWLKAGALGASVVIASSVLDNRGFRFARDHADASWMRNGVRVGNALPWLGLAASGLIALDGTDPRRSRTAFAAAEAGVTALVASTGLKYVVGRSRPEAGRGNRNFEPFSSGGDFDAFPSRHASVAWAVATPFALEYDAPWLYGIAALTNLARVGSRDHWFSDTVGGSLLGYGLGRIFWESSRSRSKYAPRVFLSPDGLGLAWETY